MSKTTPSARPATRGRRLPALVLATALAVVGTGGAIAVHNVSSPEAVACTWRWVYTYGYRGWDYYFLCIAQPSGGGGGGSW